jgi:hypothetical protein
VVVDEIVETVVALLDIDVVILPLGFEGKVTTKTKTAKTTIITKIASTVVHLSAKSPKCLISSST